MALVAPESTPKREAARGVFLAARRLRCAVGFADMLTCPLRIADTSMYRRSSNPPHPTVRPAPAARKLENRRSGSALRPAPSSIARRGA